MWAVASELTVNEELIDEAAKFPFVVKVATVASDVDPWYPSELLFWINSKLSLKTLRLFFIFANAEIVALYSSSLFSHPFPSLHALI